MYLAENKLVATKHYYPFGAPLEGRGFTSSNGYRYGFNGKENDNEVKNVTGSQQDYGMRIYDTRLGRFLSVDPLTSKFPWYTPYQFAGNKPIEAVDLDGKEEWKVNESNSTTTQSSSTTDNVTNTTTSATTTNTSATAYGPYKNAQAVSDAITNGTAQLGNVNTNTEVTTTNTTTYNNWATSSGENERGSKDLDNAAVLSGAIDQGYGAWEGSITKKSISVEGVGTGLSIVATVLGDAQVINQYREGGLNNVNPFDATVATLGTASTVIKIMSWADIGGSALSATGEFLGPVGMGVQSIQTWGLIYQSMNNLRVAPQYIDDCGEPHYETMPTTGQDFCGDN